MKAGPRPSAPRARSQGALPRVRRPHPGAAWHLGWPERGRAQASPGPPRHLTRQARSPDPEVAAAAGHPARVEQRQHRQRVLARRAQRAADVRHGHAVGLILAAAGRRPAPPPPPRPARTTRRRSRRPSRPAHELARARPGRRRRAAAAANGERPRARRRRDGRRAGRPVVVGQPGAAPHDGHVVEPRRARPGRARRATATSSPSPARAGDRVPAGGSAAASSAVGRHDPSADVGRPPLAREPLQSSRRRPNRARRRPGRPIGRAGPRRRQHGGHVEHLAAADGLGPPALAQHVAVAGHQRERATGGASGRAPTRPGASELGAAEDPHAHRVLARADVRGVRAAAGHVVLEPGQHRERRVDDGGRVPLRRAAPTASPRATSW